MGSSAVSFQTPVPLYEAENSIFGSLPWANTSGQAQSGAYSGIQGLNTSPLSNSPFSTYANNLGAYGNYVAAQAPGAINSGQNVYNATTGAAPAYTNAANSVLGNMFNNQQGYYNQLQQQNTDQSNAENAMAGVATTPYGAALTNQSNLNFNNQWQSFLNSQQNTAANTASTLGNTANSLYNTGIGALASGASSASNLLGGGSNAIGTGFNVPSTVASQQYNAQQGQIQDYLNYILGNTTNSGAYTSAVNASTNAGAASTSSLAQSQQAANSGKSGIGGALGGLGSLAGDLIPD